MKETKEITVLQYAKYLGKTSQNINNHIKNRKWEFIPDVISVNKYSRFKLLVVDASLPTE